MDNKLEKVAIITSVIVVAWVVHLNFDSLMYCFGDEFTAKYYMDSMCFDSNYRCQVECNNYGFNFTGIVDGCACDCGTGWVSACSGFYYDKDPDGQNLMRITGDEIVEYPNGTTEPLGQEPGIYPLEGYG